MARKLTPKLKPVPALEMTRVATGSEKLVYVLLANRGFAYPHGNKSRVAYIGTTKKGVARIGVVRRIEQGKFWPNTASRKSPLGF